MGELAGSAGQPGRAQILDGGNAGELVEPQARLGQQLLEEWVADLDGRPALGGPLVHLDRGEGRPVNAVASGVGADQEHDVTGPIRAGTAQPVVRNQADAHGVDDGVVGVAAIEMDLAADGRAAEAIAVAADPGDHAVEEVAVMSRIERAKAQRIQNRNRSGAHREHVAEDAAHTGGRPLIRLDRRRVIVRLDLEDHRQSIANIDRPRVLARPLQDIRTLGGQLTQERLRGLVRAVLAPERAEHAELEVVWIAPDGTHDGAVLVLVQRDFLELGAPGRNRHQTATRANAWMAERNTARPSLPPSRSSQARSGCGIMPNTLPRAFAMPAMLLSDPFGFDSAVTRPSGAQ